MLMLTLYNSRTRQKEHFKPLHEKDVGLYSCGPTVYNFVHIGNLRAFLFADVLKRVLKYNGYDVQHVMNITDVGHLTDDADQGEDKMEKGSAREGKSAWDVAKFYTEAFMNDIEALNVLPANEFPRATDHIDEQIAMVQALTDAGHTYETSDGIYFDTTTIEDYGQLANLENQQLEAGARVDMGEKKHPHDFALWKFTKPGEERQMEWEAFGKKGFPGWHIECSAMSVKYLGEQFDIHTGGIDHKSIHHPNEIAQTESVTGKKPWVNFWMHNEFLNLKGEKMAKSGDNFITLQTVVDKGISPLGFRYFVLQAHYRKQLTFTWDALEAADKGLKNLRDQIKRIDPHTQADHGLEKQFLDAINDDLNTPEALAVLHKGLKEGRVSLQTVIEFDKVLGLDLHDHAQHDEPVPAEVTALLDQRQTAREEKNWDESDRLRDEIASHGYTVEDTADGQTVFKT